MPSGTEQTALIVYLALMAAGALLFWTWSRDPKGVPAHEYGVAIFIPIWSGLAYFATMTGQGIVEIAGREVYVARYLDWVVTTPLLLLALFWTATLRVKTKSYTLAGMLIGAQVVMILSGLIADLSVTSALRTVWFLIGCAALLVVFYIFWGPLRRIAALQGDALARVYTIAATYLTVQWCLYPLIVYAGPSHADLIARPVETWLLVIVPFFSKVGFSAVDLSLLRRLPHGEEVEVFDPHTQKPMRA
ncbi:MAG: bacteriorhodopsin [Paracoccaceae bacterium]